MNKQERQELDDTISLIKEIDGLRAQLCDKIGINHPKPIALDRIEYTLSKEELSELGKTRLRLLAERIALAGLLLNPLEVLMEVDNTTNKALATIKPKKHRKKLKVKQAENESEPPSPIVVYYRVSTKKQDFDTQQHMVGEWLRLHNLNASLVVEEKVSGSVHYKDRKLGKEVLPALENGGTLLVQAVDRLSRNVVDFDDFLKELEDKGVRLITVLDGVDRSAQG